MALIVANNNGYCIVDMCTIIGDLREKVGIWGHHIQIFIVGDNIIGLLFSKCCFCGNYLITILN
jgi:hypothetical protein